jgi:hypothetical protein
MGALLQLAPLAAGWAKLAELRRHMEAFAASGKWTVAWMSQVCVDMCICFRCDCSQVRYSFDRGV